MLLNKWRVWTELWVEGPAAVTERLFALFWLLSLYFQRSEHHSKKLWWVVWFIVDFFSDSVFLPFNLTNNSGCKQTSPASDLFNLIRSVWTLLIGTFTPSNWNSTCETWCTAWWSMNWKLQVNHISTRTVRECLLRSAGLEMRTAGQKHLVRRAKTLWTKSSVLWMRSWSGLGVNEERWLRRIPKCTIRR